MIFFSSARMGPIGACLCATFILTSAAAQDGVGSPQRDELVVAAFRQTGAERLPASVTVIDADTIRATTVQHFEELIEWVPNLNFSGDGNRARYIQVRGIGELEQYQGAPNPSVGVII